MAGEEGLEPSHAGIKTRCLDQLWLLSCDYLIFEL